MNKSTLIAALLVVIIALLAYPQINKHLEEQELKSRIEIAEQEVKTAELAFNIAEFNVKNAECKIKHPKKEQKLSDSELNTMKERLTGDGRSEEYITAQMIIPRIGYVIERFWNGEVCRINITPIDRVLFIKELNKVKDGLTKEELKHFETDYLPLPKRT
ncbi:MAG: hypothetical protein JKX76_04980 [Colwellia sp.]|nr:hypothetical protein [Colwellia sp.]